MRIGSGGRFGEVKVWNIPDLEEMINQVKEPTGISGGDD